jgi:hypothetical protein
VPVFAFYDAQQTGLTQIDLEVGQESKPIVVRLPPPDPGRVSGAFAFADDGLLVEEVPELTSQNPANPYKVFRAVAAKPGSWTVQVQEVGRKTSREAGRLLVKVRKVQPSDPDLDYRGTYLAWLRHLPPGLGPDPLIFHATSGLDRHQIAHQMKEKDLGPVPEGTYRLLARLDPKQDSVAAANRVEARRTAESITNLNDGVQFLPVGGNGPVYPSWGTLRVKLTPVRVDMGRREGGFYLHNSHKGFSHGCIEVGTTPTRVDFFTTLLRFATATTPRPFHLALRVKYGHREQSTLGDTLR